jgi:hypothetical protein
MPQFNGKQECDLGNSPSPYLRCPRNGQLDEWSLPPFHFHHSATERPEQALGKAMEVVPSARIPADKVVAFLEMQP